MPMNQVLLPNVNSFRMVFDDVPFVPSGVAWHDSLHLDIWLSFGPDPTVGVLQLIVEDPNLRSSQGESAPAPQSIQWKP